MRGAKLISYTKSLRTYKGDRYFRVLLNFEINYIGLFKKKKSIIYDVTMFESIDNHLKHWDDLIETGDLIPFKDVVDREIFKR